ncbi:hypothetical protein [Streptomyces spiramyceticus]|uniref:hypothetical protein n=1 Tax=Streptomyces spiramyceticus TaxID=299717 RepID=UPI00237AB90C|nr:hypothetical protein [Streptomyces spiramyceticus]
MPAGGRPGLARSTVFIARGQLLTEMGSDDGRPALTGPAEAEARLAEFVRHAPYIRHRLEEQHRAMGAFLTCHAPESTE